ncbi:uncharacterized protein LOC127094260 [Lathyrus oleraceus]|uniref:uncharacterized protein LOC127094260 n=1 Tax=Pisum sativum TaxID=3888 RepID=UPI0021CF418C|nr:uncharacterized protein LOC127094260 [Pisum sativum]
MAIKIKEDVKKQIDAGFLVTSEYPQWLANILPVPKKDRKVRLCVDYKDLNKASPKDDFPLPHIDMLVDSTAKFKDETGRKEYDIYYLSKKFTDCESRHFMLEKTYCALAWVAKRLRQYMMNHTTWLMSKMDPIKYIFEKPALTGRITHEDVMYLKAKDCNEPLLNEKPEPGSQWGLIFDGAVNAYGNGIGEVIITPHGSHIPFTARLTFKCTNNMPEYEACIMGLEEAIDLRIKNLNVYGDSALLVNQIKGEWETRQPGQIPYKDYARRLSTFFNNIEFHHIPREEN